AGGRVSGGLSAFCGVPHEAETRPPPPSIGITRRSQQACPSSTGNRTRALSSVRRPASPAICSAVGRACHQGHQRRMRPHKEKHQVPGGTGREASTRG
ncbi:hypothetical protein RZS08_16305, partial [Arthrospira platensis SPKY1]|nr:hypothetical protein [Arthrospira platensis SPKY1]